MNRISLIETKTKKSTEDYQVHLMYIYILVEDYSFVNIDEDVL